jgi:hypothetical protein
MISIIAVFSLKGSGIYSRQKREPTIKICERWPLGQWERRTEGHQSFGLLVCCCREIGPAFRCVESQVQMPKQKIKNKAKNIIFVVRRLQTRELVRWREVEMCGADALSQMCPSWPRAFSRLSRWHLPNSTCIWGLPGIELVT